MIRLQGFLKDPFLMFGFQDISPDFEATLEPRYTSFKQWLERQGVKDITVLDYEDPRADMHWDMNEPFPKPMDNVVDLINQNTRFSVVCDIGCLEHVFDTRTALKNCLEAVAEDGLYVLHTPVKGYYNHGIHTFNAEVLKWVIENNGFEVVYEKYSNKAGVELGVPQRAVATDVLLWIAARRVERVNGNFIIPYEKRKSIKATADHRYV